MTGFPIRFLSACLFPGGIIGIFFVCRRLLASVLTAGMRYRLWYLILILLAVPFVPLPSGLSQLFPWPEDLRTPAGAGDFTRQALSGILEELSLPGDFALSVSHKTPYMVQAALAGIWIAGMLIMSFYVFRSLLRLRLLQKSALPVQNSEILPVYRSCLLELNIRTEIPLYSTRLLHSPAMAGLLRPGIYLPSFLLYDDSVRKLRFIFLHELQHFRHRDAVAGCLMNLAAIVYWFHPLVRWALREMRLDRELACDAAVLERLEAADQEAYGSALIDFAEKISRRPFPFAAGLSGSKKQIYRRILQIVSWRKPSAGRKRMSRLAGGGIALVLILSVLILSAPLLSTHYAGEARYRWESFSVPPVIMDLSAYFGDCEGSFVLYDEAADAWYIHDMEHALLRTSPESTWKIYDALIGLEEGVITPDRSLLAWDGTSWPFGAWNRNQDLRSAMGASVNWYFQEIDRQLGPAVLRQRIGELGYGNGRAGRDPSSCWMQSSLQISPVEQVLLLMDLYHGELDFSPENMNAVTESICLYSSGDGSLHGKTGTGRVNDRDVNGWFVGYVESDGRTCFFAANIKAAQDASGNRAAELTLSVLSDLGLLKPGQMF